jgi:hypothetical protein
MSLSSETPQVEVVNEQYNFSFFLFPFYKCPWSWLPCTFIEWKTFLRVPIILTVRKYLPVTASEGAIRR